MLVILEKAVEAMLVLLGVSVVLLLAAGLLGFCRGDKCLQEWWKGECKGSLDYALANKGMVLCLILTGIAILVGTAWLLALSFSGWGWVMMYALPPITFFVYWWHVMLASGATVKSGHVGVAVLGTIFWPVALCYLVTTLISAVAMLGGDRREDDTASG